MIKFNKSILVKMGLNTEDDLVNSLNLQKIKGIIDSRFRAKMLELFTSEEADRLYDSLAEDESEDLSNWLSSNSDKLNNLYQQEYDVFMNEFTEDTLNTN